jgi:hypothetical protein
MVVETQTSDAVFASMGVRMKIKRRIYWFDVENVS